MKKHLSILATLLLSIVALSVSSCSDDDDLIKDDLSGTKWEVISSTDDDFLVGDILEFHKDGIVVYPWGKEGKWSANKDVLKMTIFTDCDYLIGSISFNKDIATYNYHWVCTETNGESHDYTFVLKKL